MLFFIVAFGNMMGTFWKLWEPIEKSREYNKNTIKIFWVLGENTIKKHPNIFLK
jgi:hypothetical protein